MELSPEFDKLMPEELFKKINANAREAGREKCIQKNKKNSNILVSLDLNCESFRGIKNK